MRQLVPKPANDVDPAALYAADRRPPPAGRPWLLVNMVSSADGGTAVHGVSAPLGGPGDKRVFAALRAIADVVLVAAGTVRAERYGPPTVSDEQRAARRARGQTDAPRLAIVSASLDLDPAARVFTSDPRPWLVTTSRADAGRLAALDGRVEVLTAGADTVDFALALRLLGEQGARVVLAEGGPSLNGQLVAADLVDELCLTLAPLAVSGASARIAHGPDRDAPARLELARVLEEDGTLFLRYVRGEDGAAPR